MLTDGPESMVDFRREARLDSDEARKSHATSSGSRRTLNTMEPLSSTQQLPSIGHCHGDGRILNFPSFLPADPSSQHASPRGKQRMGYDAPTCAANREAREQDPEWSSEFANSRLRSRLAQCGKRGNKVPDHPASFPFAFKFVNRSALLLDLMICAS
ncbi:hypothetical protein N657DRAFT_456992 [Parathielavia appendiculata]|uniref:Uncharacterized protein n=1 Tax=Parathielavia appendiculata TaxID=2587402 RepID=A0AAN6TYZ1_9PEZI|nr:hypothetical protein N657DRAFT_456992 [Parathielavia appendiculata]